MIDVVIIVVTTKLIVAPLVKVVAIWIKKAAICVDIEAILVVCTCVGRGLGILSSLRSLLDVSSRSLRT